MRIKFIHTYNDIISVGNLLEAWKEFRVGKRKRKDVQVFERNLMSNIITLHRDLAIKTYRHGGYEFFKISDPKPRNIHKATVRDRLIHHAIYRILYPFFDRIFISDSYSCRLNKGQHKGINRLRTFIYRESRRHTRTIWVLKCDVRKFFASIDHARLMQILSKYINDPDIQWLLGRVIDSFHSTKEGVGLPLGNLTSQLLVNIYMNDFDQCIKHLFRVKYYIRFADDFVIVSHDRDWLDELLPKIGDVLSERLGLDLHPDKVSVRTIVSGVDFLGWVHFTHHRVLRTSTKHRMLNRIRERGDNETTLRSYLGLLSHGNGKKLEKVIVNMTKE